ncbi:MAG: polyphosphate kinase 2 family protein [Candidatus Omnitrophota bacterium]
MKYSECLQVKPGRKVYLNKIAPQATLKHKGKASAKQETEDNIEHLRDLQYRLYAEGKRSVLICLQALDAAGKDGTINHVLGAMNPQGTRVCGFKVPTKEEAAHDFLWRIEKQVPAKGEIVVFNRSHYEDVLVTRVHKTISKETVFERFDLINDFEKRLAANGTLVLKFFLHISPGEQLRRFKQRIDDPARHWKISEFDYQERELWNDYVRAYEDVLSNTSTPQAPWFVIPADHKWFRNLAVSGIVVEMLESLDMKLPKPQVDIDAIRKQYHKALKQEINHSKKR